jgi:KaiC/GvpD/RAD55 family RecA-like ATPase
MLIPEELKKHRQWVNWKLITREGKQTKVPFQPNGAYASSTDPATWCMFSELAKVGFSGFGFVFSQEDPYIGIDLDGCRNPETGELDAWAKAVVVKFGTYAEVSPSGTGVKLFGVSDSIWKHSNKTELAGEGYGDKKPGIEVYDCGRYFAITGKQLKGLSSIQDVTDSLAWLADEYKLIKPAFVIDGRDVAIETPLTERAAKYLAKMEPSVSGSRGHDACWKAACVLVQGFGLTDEQAFSLLATEFNPRCQPNWTEKELRHKIAGASKAPGQRGYLADARPSDWNKIYVRTGPVPIFDDESAEFVPTGVKRTLLSDAAAQYVKQLAEGKEYLIETGIPELDEAIGGGVAPGEMVIVAARPSHGKSAIALQMVHHMTANGVAAVIVSEEMSALAIGKRTVQFASDVPEHDWRSREEDVESQLNNHFANRAKALVIESCGTVQKVVEEVEKAVEEMGAGVVVVDYVQLLAAKGTSRYEQVTASSQEMRRMASRLGVVVIVLAQLNRNIEERKKFVPQSSDLKETGQLEQDADVIIFGVWPHRIDHTSKPETYQFFVGKNRNRAINSSAFNVVFEPSRQRLLEESSKGFVSTRHDVSDEWFT